MAQEKYNVYFYGVVTPVSQDSQKNITQDLFSAQIRVISEINFIDRRDAGFREKYSSLSDSEIAGLSKDSVFSLLPDSAELKQGLKSIALTASIEKTDDENWKCRVYAKNYDSSKTFVKEKEFESYYKVLAESRTLIVEVLSECSEVALSTGQVSRRPPMEPINEVAMTVEGVSGTWNGENGITKIILMRSGRGFIIFNNGASMNITISVELNKEEHKILKITQAGPFNASFYPDIPRHEILSFAQDAKPIEWNFVLTGTGTLIGFKDSLTMDENGKIFQARSRVKWDKLN